MRTFDHLDQNDRDRMEILLDQGIFQKDIAGVLQVAPSTISREKKERRKKNGEYEASSAQHKAYVKRKNSKYQGMKVESDEQMKAYIIAGLKEKRSPDEIAGRMKLEKKPFYAAKDAIYRWLYSARGQKYAHYLCTKRYRKKKQKRNGKRHMIPNRISISQRPKGATNKTRYKHFEIDTAVAPKKVSNNEAIAVGAERKSKFIMANKLKSLSNKEMTGAVNGFARRANMLSATGDNGIENRGHGEWEVPAYFADPHSPWQKPLVESSIGLLRRWFYKKGTDWSKVSEKDLQEAIAVLNNKYRKSLGYKSAMEVALEHDILKNQPQ
jgi:IS30 family transposase